MRIGVDVTCWTNRRGFGRFTREILSSLLALDPPAEFYFLIDRQSAPLCAFPAKVHMIEIPTREAQGVAASANGYRSVPDILRMSRAAASGRYDLFFFPAVYSYFPLPPGRKCIVTFHDAIAEHHPDLIFPTARARLFWHWKARLARRQATLILTVSHHARESLIHHWRLDPARVRAIREAPGSIFRPTHDKEALSRILGRLSLANDTRYLIYVGGISPHKNLALLVEVFCELAQEPGFQDIRLLLVGDHDKDVFYSSLPDIRARLESYKPSRVLFTGFVPDEDLLHLYNGAVALVLPSLEEGFGLPAIEAMACGIPVLASRAGSLPEVVADAGLLFDPHSPRELSTALRAVLTDGAKQTELAARALGRAREFSWNRAAETLWDMCREVVAS